MPQWSRKDYNKIARILKNLKPTMPPTPILVAYWEHVVKEFTATFATDSPYFNEEKFLKACGYEPESKLDEKEVLERGYF